MVAKSASNALKTRYLSKIAIFHTLPALDASVKLGCQIMVIMFGIKVHRCLC